MTDVFRLVDGGDPVLIPRVSPPRYTGIRLTYGEGDSRRRRARLTMRFKNAPRGARGIIELAGDYIEGLRQIVRDAERERLFDLKASPQGAQ